ISISLPFAPQAPNSFPSRRSSELPAGDLSGLLGGRLFPGLGDVGNVLVGLLVLPLSAYLVMVLAAGHARAARLLLTADRGEELRSEEHTSELQSRENVVCRLLLVK